jgi:histidinol-phosphate phosphatase family protein
MQAVIMAGGKGTRLASVAKDIPKPMVRINGKPLLEYQVENLKRDGIENIILVIGYLGEIIVNHFGNGGKFGVDISYYVEEKPLGTAGALAGLYDRLEDTFALLLGDLFIDVSFNKFIEFHHKKGAMISLFAHPNSHPCDSDIIITDCDNRVVEWSCKNTERLSDYRNLVNAGLYVVNKEAVAGLPLNQKTDFEKDIICKKIKEGRIFAYQSTEYVKDIGTPQRLEKVANDYEKGICAKRNLRNKQKCLFLDRDGTINKFVGFLRDADQVELEPGAAQAIRLINESEYLAVVITNQPVIARGECTFEELEGINNRLCTLLGNEGAYIDDLYYCPHHPDSGFTGEVRELKYDCGCRKPKIGMLIKAADKLNINLAESWIIGDTDIDIQTGVNAGTHTVLLKSGDIRKKTKYDAIPDVYTDNLLCAVKEILSYSGA